MTGLRLLSVLFGAFCAPLVYRMGRLAWGRVAGLAAGGLLSISHLHIHYSRIALNNIESVWFMILLMLLFFHAHAQAVGQAKASWIPAVPSDVTTPSPAPPLGP